MPRLNSEGRVKTMKNSAVKMILAAATATILTGCGDSFVGTYEFEDSSETLTINKDGTCLDVNNGMEIGCEWKKTDDGQYAITVNSGFGPVKYRVKKTGGKTYELSAFGISTTMTRK